MRKISLRVQTEARGVYKALTSTCNMVRLKGHINETKQSKTKRAEDGVVSVRPFCTQPQHSVDY